MIHRYILLISLVVLSGCFPRKDDVRREFLSETPNCTIVNIGTAEGDADAVYYIINYKLNDSGAELSQERLYLYKNGKWVLTTKINIPRAGLQNKMNK
jgi:hypothetical protein